MNIRSFKTLENGVYRVSVKTEDWSEGDRQLMQRFGEPYIDIGGRIYFEDGYQYFDADNKLQRIRSDSPFFSGFDIRDYDDAMLRADAWYEAIVNRLIDAVTLLRNNVDGFTGESVRRV